MNKRGITRLWIALLSISIIILIILIAYFLFVKAPEAITGETSCISLGCYSDTLFVGSINSDKYYPCGCRYASQINPENVVCFSSEQEALDEGRIRSEC